MAVAGESPPTHTRARITSEEALKQTPSVARASSLFTWLGLKVTGRETAYDCPCAIILLNILMEIILPLASHRTFASRVIFGMRASYPGFEFQARCNLIRTVQ